MSTTLHEQPSPTVARPWSSHESPTLHEQPGDSGRQQRGET